VWLEVCFDGVLPMCWKNSSCCLDDILSQSVSISWIRKIAEINTSQPWSFFCTLILLNFVLRGQTLRSGWGICFRLSVLMDFLQMCCGQFRTQQHNASSGCQIALATRSGVIYLMTDFQVCVLYALVWHFVLLVLGPWTPGCSALVLEYLILSAFHGFF